MKRNLIIISITIIYLFVTLLVSIKYIDNKNNYVNQNYKIVFRGETVDSISSTYIYKIVKTTKQKKKTKKTIYYKYINTIINKNNVDYTNSLEKITKKGYTKDIDEIKTIIEENNATTYAEINKDKSLIKVYEYKYYL